MMFVRNQHRLLAFGCIVWAMLALSWPAVAAKDARPEAPSVRFQPPGGLFASNVPVQLTATKPGVIRYTLDGREPEESSPIWSGPQLLTNSTQIRARLYEQTPTPSASVAAVYTLVEKDLLEFTSNLPLLIFNTFGTNIVHEFKIEGGLQIVDGGSNRTSLTSPANFSGRSAINLRGRASLRYPKSSYTVKLLNGDGDAHAAELLGLPADADWVLYAPYPDKTLIRDVVAYDLNREMGHWATRTRFLEVFVNQRGGKLSRRDYVGVYVLEERIKRAKHRVDIANLKPEDESEPRLTGGYIFKKDHVDTAGFAMGGEGYGAGPQSSPNTKAGYPTKPGGFPADPAGFLPAATVTRSSSSSSSSRRSTVKPVLTNVFGFHAAAPGPDFPGNREITEDSLKEEESFKTSRTNEFYFVEPEPDEITSVQKAWLKNHLNQFEAALYGPDFRNEKKGYHAFIDVDSFIDYHLFTEVTKNVDGFRFSVFFHKDRGGKIKADPVWDWNLSFGNCNGKQGWMPEYWLWPQLDDKECSWYRRLFEDPDFGQRYVDRWSELRTNLFATKSVVARIDALAQFLQESQKRNFERWPILGKAINPNHFVGMSYEDEIGFMRRFIETRLEWIERQFVAVPKGDVQSTGGRKVAALTAARGEVFYTLDGSDPRATGGAVSGQARPYQSPVTLEPGQKIFARSKVENRWSGPLRLE